MGHSRLDEISAFLATHWKDTLEKNGFFPTQDSVEWVRLTDGRVMQIILCSAFAAPEILFYSQTLSEYMWCNYRSQVHMTSYSGNFFRHANIRREYYCRNKLAMRAWNEQMQYTLETLNTIHTAQDILSYPRERELVFYRRPCLWYDAGDIDGTWKALENTRYPDYVRFQGEISPQKLKRDYWQVWQPQTARVARECLATGSLQPLADFAEESRAFNLKYLKRYMPWLFQ